MTFIRAVPPVPAGANAQEIADWGEIYVAHHRSALTRGQLTAILRREDFEAERLPADVWRELLHRRDVIGARWPFKANDDQLIPRKPNLLYFFLSVLGLRFNVDNKGRELFEHCVTHVARQLTGRAAIRLGFPRRTPVAKSFPEAVRRYCNACGELLLTAPPATDGDLGLDIATWRKFADERGGYLSFLGQCAAGADWRDKLGDLSISKWGDYVHWSPAPVRFFAVPFFVHATDVRRVSQDAGLLLDRPRLVELGTRFSQSAIAKRIREYLLRIY
jgi:hypothetical protein